MVAKWIDSQELSESDKKDRQVHLCLMGNDGKKDNEKDNFKVLDVLNSCYKDELEKSLFDMFQIDQILKDEIKELENRIRYYAEVCEDLTK